MKKKIISLLMIFCVVLVFTGCSSSKSDELYLEGAKAYDRGDYQAALEKFQAAKENGTLDKYSMSELYSCLGNTYMSLGDMDKAFESYQAALDEDPDEVRNYTNLAIAYRRAGDSDAAKELYLRALEIDPDYPELNSSLGTLYMLEGDLDEAIKYFDKAIELDPDMAVAYGNGALAYAMNDDFQTAEEYLELAVKKGYSNADVIEEMIEEERSKNS